MLYSSRSNSDFVSKTAFFFFFFFFLKTVLASRDCQEVLSLSRSIRNISQVFCIQSKGTRLLRVENSRKRAAACWYFSRQQSWGIGGRIATLIFEPQYFDADSNLRS